MKNVISVGGGIAGLCAAISLQVSEMFKSPLNARRKRSSLSLSSTEEPVLGGMMLSTELYRCTGT